MKNTFTKPERLKRRKLIDALFAKKQSLGSYPLRFFWMERKLQEGEVPPVIPMQAAFSVPKKRFKRANQRNRIKRQIRELYRLHKQTLYDALRKKNKYIIGMWVFVGQEKPTWEDLKIKLPLIMSRFIQNL